MTSTCLAAFKTGLTTKSRDTEEQEQLTIAENHCELDIVEADDEDEARQGEVVIQNSKNSFMHKCLMSNHYTICLYVLMSLLIFSSSVALIIIIVQTVIPYKSVLSFVNGTCIPSALVAQDGKTCMCGVGCSARYRCLTIQVTYEFAAKQWRNTTFYENESIMGQEVRHIIPLRAIFDLQETFNFICQL